MDPSPSDTKRRLLRPIVLVVAALALPGCSGHASPSWTLFGAYFPAWLVCGVLGVIAAIAARFGFVASGLATVIPLQLWVCTAVGIIAASLCWLVWLGH